MVSLLGAFVAYVWSKITYLCRHSHTDADDPRYVSLRKRQQLTKILKGNFRQLLLAGTLRVLMLTFDFFSVLRKHSNLGPVIFLTE
jgi:steroid 5-alpha reductase family enzyme